MSSSSFRQVWTADCLPRRSGRIQAHTAQISKLIVRIRFLSPAPGLAGQLRASDFQAGQHPRPPDHYWIPGSVLWLRGEFCQESQRRFVVEPGARPEGAGQVAEVIAGRRLAVQLAEPFSFAEAVELGRDN